MRCPTCGYEEVPNDAIVCPRCQTDLAQDQQRSADVEVEVEVGTVSGAGRVTGLDIGRARDIFIDAEPYRAAQRRRNRLSLLDIIWQSWIEGVLEKIEASYGAISGGELIELNKRELREAVDSDSDAGDEISYLQPESRQETITTPVVTLFGDSGRSLLILGAPGAGKTVALLQLAREELRRAWQDEERPIPIMLNLASWAEKRLALADWIVEELSAPQYRVPRQMGREWVEDEAFLLLLDGLDEVPQALRDDCIRSINQFTATYFARIAVACRTEAYESVTAAGEGEERSNRLQLRRAISLEPLTQAQVEATLTSAGERLAALQTAYEQDLLPRDFVNTPLTLSIVTMTYADQSVDKMEAGQWTAPGATLATPEASWDQVFTAYVERMFDYKGTDEQSFERSQTMAWLSWLARQMSRHRLTTFWIEDLQPSWLPSRRPQLLYMLGSRLIVTLIGGLVGGLILGVANGITRGWDTVWLGLVQGLLGGAVAGVTCGAVDAAWLFRENADVATGASSDARIRLRDMGIKFGLLALSTWLAVIAVFGLLSLVVGGTTLSDFLSVGQGAQVGLILALCCGWVFAFSPGDVRHTLNNDIQTVERLSWSRENAQRGTVIGVLVGLVAGVAATFVARFTPLVGPIEARFEAWIAVVLATALLAAFFIGLAGLVLGGIRGSVIESGKMRPNQGFVMSLGNIAVTGPLVSLVFGALGALTGWMLGDRETMLTMGLYGLFFGVIAAFWYGGFFAVQHLTLRYLLWRADDTPRPGQLALFLDDAARRVLLRKVGGGYMFVNRYLQGYFKGMDGENNLV